jgi:hypothetical protein
MLTSAELTLYQTMSIAIFSYFVVIGQRFSTLALSVLKYAGVVAGLSPRDVFPSLLVSSRI